MWLKKFYRLFYPFLVYHIVILSVISIAQSIIGRDEAHYALCNIVAVTCTLPVMFWIYHQDRIQTGRKRFVQCVDRDLCYHLFFITVSALLIGMALNNLILMSPLVGLSRGFAEVNRNFFGSTFFLEVVSSGLMTPVLEELVFRGILYQRFREDYGKMPSILLSAIVFGVVHFNWVQFVYAFLIGLVLALYLERCGHLYGAIAAHAVMNLVSVIRSETGFLGNLIDGSRMAWSVSLLMLLVGVALCIYYMTYGGKGGNRFKDDME